MVKTNITLKIKNIREEIKELYLNDSRPWIIGLSGGKDSSCVTQMVYYVIKELPPDKRKKEIHVISADTLVESPLIERRIKSVLSDIEKTAKKDKLPIKVKLIRPKLNDTFWVNLIGRGYPSPNRWFRWCTDRLKIRPADEYIKSQVKENSEVIILLGARKSESATRAQTMGKYSIKNFRLKKHNIPGAFVYTPIEDLTNKEVWIYLKSVPPPWGKNNFELQTFYRKADRECPLVINKDTPSCGNSRFGCWTCTVVARDRSLEGLIEDGEEWLKPLLNFRNWLKDIRDKPEYRESIRKNDRRKKITAEKSGYEFIPPEHRGHKMIGPFTFKTRHEILKKLLKIQKEISSINKMELISPEELKSIENIWIYEGDDITSLSEVIDDSKNIIKKINGSPLSQADVNKKIIHKIITKYDVPLALVEKLLIAEKDLSSMSTRKGIYNKLESVIEEHMMRKYLEKNK